MILPPTAIQCDTIRFDLTQCNTMRYNAIQCDAEEYYTMEYIYKVVKICSLLLQCASHF